MDNINFRKYLNFDKAEDSYCTINREERNLTTILFHMLLEKNNIDKFLNMIGLQYSIDMESQQFGIYPEYAFIRDLWNKIDKGSETNKFKRQFILDFLSPPNKIFLENLSNEEFNKYFGSNAKNNISSPMRWSKTKFSKEMDKTYILNVCKFKWCFKSQPDIVIHISNDRAVCIEAKLESPIGSYSCNGNENTSQLEIQEKVMKYLGIKSDFLLISREGGEKKGSWQQAKWKDIFELFDTSHMPAFIQKTIQNM